MKLGWLKFKSGVKGMFDNTIPYSPILEDGDSSPYFGTYEGQRFGQFDTSCCWDFSACEVAETRLEILWKKGLIPEETKTWLKANGYIDDAGDFYLSRRWAAILSGVKDGGNNPLNFWQIASVAGLIPNKMLPYDPKEASKWINQNQFNNDYFNPQVITAEMENMGKEFLKYFKIQAENIWGGYVPNISTTLQTYLKEGSLQICHPVPQNGSWNSSLVFYPKGRTKADHATECYKFDPTIDFPIYDYDSYEPHLKQLSKDYYVPIITRIAITPLTASAPEGISEWTKFWINVAAWLTGKKFPYPSVLVGAN